jgi:hypothetical protein
MRNQLTTSISCRGNAVPHLGPPDQKRCVPPRCANNRGIVAAVGKAMCGESRSARRVEPRHPLDSVALSFHRRQTVLVHPAIWPCLSVANTSCKSCQDRLTTFDDDAERLRAAANRLRKRRRALASPIRLTRSVSPVTRGSDASSETGPRLLARFPALISRLGSLGEAPWLYDRN